MDFVAPLVPRVRMDRRDRVIVFLVPDITPTFQHLSHVAIYTSPFLILTRPSVA